MTPPQPDITDWEPASPRDEIRPAFHLEIDGGPDGHGGLVIEANQREGLDGFWTCAFPVIGGQHYRFTACARAEDVPVPRRSVVVKIDWRGSDGEPVDDDRPICSGYLPGYRGCAETEHPAATGT